MLVQKTADSVTFTEEILNGKLYFLCSERLMRAYPYGLNQKIGETFHTNNNLMGHNFLLLLQTH